MADLLSLQDAKSFLNVTDTSGDAMLAELISAASTMLQNRIGPVTATGTLDEWYDGGAPTISLLSRPVLSVTSVTETFGANIIRTLTAQPLDGVTPVDAYGYTADLATGLVVRRVAGIASPFAIGRRNIHVVYTAGFAAVPPDITYAMQLLVKHFWDSRTGVVRLPAGQADMYFAGDSYSWPRRVQEIVSYYEDGGFA